MQRRFELRKQQLLAECDLGPETFDGIIERLADFVQPFAACLVRDEQRRHAHTYLAGLVSDLKRKNTEAIAYRNDLDRQGLQHFVGSSPWDPQPLLGELARQVGTELGTPDGVIVFDPSGFAKKGTASVGVKRQWLGRLGKVDNGQVGIFMGYVSHREHTLVDVRLYLPKEWAADMKRRKRCGVPREVRYRTRHDLALEMLREKGELLPHAWVAGDDEMGRSSRFRADLRAMGERYLLAVPSHTTIRDLDGEAPSGSDPQRRRKRPFEQVRAWALAQPPQAWRRIEVRSGAKGPLVVDLVQTRVVAKTDRRRIGPEELLVVLRTREDDGTVKSDYYLSNAPPETLPGLLARVAKAEHRIEECLQRAKSEAGLSDYQVRTWSGWHHHQALSLLASWFLVQETRRGKKGGACIDVAASACRVGVPAACGLWV
jgi:SRSO17 transposase